MEHLTLVPHTKMQHKDRLVYLVTTDQRYGVFLAQQIGHFGYFVQIVKDLKGLENAIAEHISTAILVDISALKKQMTGEDLFAGINVFRHSSIPLMFISDHDDQKTRLKAIRAGGKAFFPKPVDTVNLIDRLDELTSIESTDPYRVLVVEDQAPIANYYKMVLTMAGMDAQVMTDATKVIQQMIEFHPDLVLLDLYMPEVNGAELVKVIRQIDEFVSIPIVFLSSEDDFNKQMEAMSLGGDDFLTKPIKASHLVALVKSRLERLKTLRSYMVRDSLTGLLNHTSSRSALIQEVNRCGRQKARLAVAMLDIDLFKQVNDTFGHAAGDNVLKSLSRLLKQRLRKSDIIGRYGGEEFMVLLLDVDVENAYLIMDEIRTHFSEVKHFATQSGSLQVTFSCGIATYPEITDPKVLTEAADKALYAAKAAGRNKIVVYNRQGVGQKS
jgi:diguanylate cyclase (GGDEF)-like protein